MRPRVLLAEDHPGMAKALGRVLALDCEVVAVVADGRDVAEAAQRFHPVVTLLDVNMPNVSGIESCRAITSANPRARVIVMTGMLDEAIDGQARAAGASGFFLKSTAGDELVAAIKRAWTESTS